LILSQTSSSKILETHVPLSALLSLPFNHLVTCVQKQISQRCKSNTISIIWWKYSTPIIKLVHVILGKNG